VSRFARLVAVGTVVQIIARCVNKEFRIRDDADRQEYLSRLGSAVERSDWKLHAYAIMSNHVHLLLRGGRDPSARFMLPLQSGFARWLNKETGRFGPVFADRHTTILYDDDAMPGLVAYLHNNVVRAGVVEDPSDSTWTSHRAYLGLDPAPSWLAVDEGLAACGFDADVAGRSAFHGMVLERVGVQRSDFWAADAHTERARTRRVAGTSLEVSSPLVREGAREVAVVSRAVPVVRPRWPGAPEVVRALVERHTGVTGLAGRARTVLVVEARRLAMRVWTGPLGREQRVMAAALGLSQAAASRLCNYGVVDEKAVELLGAMCWEGMPRAGELR
jgi:REP element-mobilizing transposase RayT